MEKITIKYNLAKKAISDFKERTFLDNIGLPSLTGKLDQLRKPDAAVSKSDEFKDYIFVLAVKDTFDSQKLIDSNYVVYSYDLNGNFIKELDPEVLGDLFFKKLIYIS